MLSRRECVSIVGTSVLSVVGLFGVAAAKNIIHKEPIECIRTEVQYNPYVDKYNILILLLDIRTNMYYFANLLHDRMVDMSDRKVAEMFIERAKFMLETKLLRNDT